MIKGILLYFLAFYLGRFSILLIRNHTLNDREEKLVDAANFLYAKEKELTAKEIQLRNYYKNLVVDISKYQFMNSPTDGKWTDMDDQYLQSWMSAEK